MGSNEPGAALVSDSVMAVTTSPCPEAVMAPSPGSQSVTRSEGGSVNREKSSQGMGDMHENEEMSLDTLGGNLVL